MEDYVEKFRKLPTQLQAFFMSDEPMLEMKKSMAMLDVNPLLSENIATEIGLMFIDALKLSTLPQIIQSNLHTEPGKSYGIAYEINSRIFNKFPDSFKESSALLAQWDKLKTKATIPENEAWQKIIEIEPWILEEEQEEQQIQQVEKDQSQRIQNNLINLDVATALKQFPEIGEQMITSERISLKNFPDAVRPSLKNWLADYVFTVGHDNTDSIKRGEYLFHSQNAMRLSGNDRQRLSYILKAHDENSAIAIDREGKQIVFEMPEANQSTAPAGSISTNISSENRSTQPQSSASLHNSISFSSPQQLPYEKLNNAPQLAQNEMTSRVKFPPIQQNKPTNSVNNVVKLEPKPEAPREFPRNVVNLRDE